MTVRNEQRLVQLLEWVVAIDPDAVSAWVDAARERRPDADDQALARSAFGHARLKATLSGVVSGLPGNPWIALPAATVDVAVVLKAHALAAARVACIHDPGLLSRGGEAARWELLVPVLGIEAEAEAEAQQVVPDDARPAAAGRFVRKKSLKIFKKLVLKHFAKRVAKRAAFGRSVPVLGAFIGGAWNFHEVARIRERTLLHFGAVVAP